MRDFPVRLIGVPDSDQLILKLIFSASKSIAGRHFSYQHDASNMKHDAQLVIIENANQNVAGQISVCIQDEDDHNGQKPRATIQRPLLATRVLGVLDTVMTNYEPPVIDKPKQTAPVEVDAAQEEGEDVIDFCISEEEASDLAIVHDDSLSNPANYEPIQPGDDHEKLTKIVDFFSSHAPHTGSQEKTAPITLKRGSVVKVLVVDDSPSVRKQLELELELYDVDVDYAETAAEAFEYIGRTDYKLILLDVMLPDGDGFAICKETKQTHPDATIIMLTGKSTQADKIKGAMAGCDDYLVKPVGRSIFQDAVEQYIPMCSEFSTSLNNESNGEVYVNK